MCMDVCIMCLKKIFTKRAHTSEHTSRSMNNTLESLLLQIYFNKNKGEYIYFKKQQQCPKVLQTLPLRRLRLSKYTVNLYELQKS